MKKDKTENIIKKIFFIISILLLFVIIKSTYSFSVCYKVTINKLNIRSGPGTNFPIISTVQKDTKVNVKEIVGEWAKLFWSKEYAWAHSKYLKLCNPKKTDDSTSVNDGIRVNADVYSNGTQLIIHNKDDFMWKNIKFEINVSDNSK